MEEQEGGVFQQVGPEDGQDDVETAGGDHQDSQSQQVLEGAQPSLHLEPLPSQTDHVVVEMYIVGVSEGRHQQPHVLALIPDTGPTQTQSGHHQQLEVDTNLAQYSQQGHGGDLGQADLLKYLVTQQQQPQLGNSTSPHPGYLGSTGDLGWVDWIRLAENWMMK